MTRNQKVMLVKALHLLNQQPRFRAADKRLRFDSYTVASEIAATLDKAGCGVVARAAIISELRRGSGDE